MKLKAAQITRLLADMPGWKRAGGSIRRQFTFPAFADAIAFVTRLAFAAEAADHHPDLLISYRKVTVTWSTHSAGGITRKDVDGARQSDTIAGQVGA